MEAKSTRQTRHQIDLRLLCRRATRRASYRSRLPSEGQQSARLTVVGDEPLVDIVDQLLAPVVSSTARREWVRAVRRGVSRAGRCDTVCPISDVIGRVSRHGCGAAKPPRAEIGDAYAMLDVLWLLLTTRRWQRHRLAVTGRDDYAPDQPVPSTAMHASAATLDTWAFCSSGILRKLSRTPGNTPYHSRRRRRSLPIHCRSQFPIPSIPNSTQQ
jgi:hypothetical protein